MTLKRNVCMLVTTDFIHDRRVRKEARSVLDMGHTLTVIATARPEDMLYGNEDGLDAEFPDTDFTFRPVRLTGRARKVSIPILSAFIAVSWTLFSYIKIMWAVFRTPADLYHCHDIDALAIARFPAWLHRAKVIFDCHDIMSDIQIEGSIIARLRPIIRRLERWLPGGCDGIIAAAPSFAKRVSQDSGVALDTIVEVLNCPLRHPVAIDGTLRKLLNLGPKDPLLLYLGSLNPDRGLDQLVSIIDNLDPKITIAMMGPGHEDMRATLRGQIADLATGNRVHLGGFVALDDVPKVLMEATAMIIPNRYISEAYNSLPNKLFEAMMAGRPFVCHDIPDMAHVVRTTECGLVLADETPQCLSQALNTLLLDETLAQRMGANGRQAAEETYNWDAQARRIEHLYIRVLGPDICD